MNKMPGSNHSNPTSTTAPSASNQNNDDWVLIGRVVGAHGLKGHVKVYPESDFPERFVQAGQRWLKKPNAQPVPIRLTSGRYLEGKNNYLVKLEGVNFRDQAEDLKGAQLMVPASDRLPLQPGEFHVGDLVGLNAVLQTDQTVLGTITNVFTTGHDLLEVTLATQEDETTEEQTTEKQTTKERDIAETAEQAPAEQLSEQPCEQPLETKETNPSLRAKAAQKLRRKAKRQQKKKKPKTLLIPFVEDIVPVVDITGGRIEITPPPGLIDL